MRTTPRRQGGSTLIIALIMLVLLTLFAVSSLNTANINLKVVGNMQAKTEALNASQATIETVISTPQFIVSPANAVPVPCGTANTLCTDLTGDGVAEFTTTLTPDPNCIAVRPIKNTELVINSPSSEDLACAAVPPTGGALIAGVQTGNSLCSNTVWEISAQTTGTDTAATATVTQGVGVRVSTDDADSSC